MRPIAQLFYDSWTPPSSEEAPGGKRKFLAGANIGICERGFGRRYRRRDDYNLPDVGVSLTLWEGVYEDGQGSWLRWVDSQGNLIPTGAERAQIESDRANHAEDRAARLAAKLRELGFNPDEV